MGPAVLFEKKLKQAVKLGTLNPAIYYHLHVPCDINCQQTIQIAQKTKRALESADIEAANYLKETNQTYHFE